MMKLTLAILTAAALGACAQVSTSTTGNLVTQTTASASHDMGAAGACDDVGELLSRQMYNEQMVLEASAAPTH